MGSGSRGGLAGRLGAAMSAGFIGAVLLGSASAAPAVAQTTPPVRVPAPIMAAIAGLKHNPPLYNAPHAPQGLTPDQEVRLRDELEDAGTPIYVAITPSIGEDTKGTAQQIYEGVKMPGTYVAISGTSYDTYSTLFEVGPMITRAFTQERDGGSVEVLSAFIKLDADQAAGNPIPAEPFPWAIVLTIAAGLIIVTAWLVTASVLRERKEREQDAHTPS